ncbi:hypothetical protein [Nocardioides donggukensis]|uniref:Uncharacterized protein n=1 Tax=Nocardioides donggukensis TaxID=2774019 RepID=A0A927Q3B2_9ACTN|nr:hypothetical protein [Nocardioides donggukensis]MBD8871169.1 hypothetical protein [Nocardioides donggukensis]
MGIALVLGMVFLLLVATGAYVAFRMYGAHEVAQDHPTDGFRRKHP